jgi:hypothetical protein
MDAVSTSTTAMDAVSASQTARDAIGTSGVGYDAIAAVAMAIGKYAAGIAGLTPSNYADIDAVASDADAMDAVSTSTTAMDAVSTSTTAMDAVSASDLALQAYLLSDFVDETLWTTPTASEAVWDEGNPTPPTTVTVGASDVDIGFNGTSEGGSSIHLQVSNFSGNSTTTTGNYTVVDAIDLTNVSTITFSTRAANSFSSGSYAFDITIGSATLSVSSQHSWTSRSLDVSGVSGLTAFEMDYGVRENADSQDWEIKNLNLD